MNFFVPVPEGQAQEPPDDYEAELPCTCEAPDFRLHIDCGSASVTCLQCKKSPAMGDWQLDLHMEDIPVTIVWERPPCTCNMRDQMSCDCGAYIVATPVLGAGQEREIK